MQFLRNVAYVVGIDQLALDVRLWSDLADSIARNSVTRSPGISTAAQSSRAQRHNRRPHFGDGLVHKDGVCIDEVVLCFLPARSGH
eukprot:2625832-Rhodomonas_salina.3